MIAVATASILLLLTPVPPAATTVGQDAAQAATPIDAAALRRQTLEQALAVSELVPAEFHGRERAKLQEAAAIAMIDAGLLDEARRVVPRIAGWRSAALLARVALEDAKAGRREQAKALAERVVAASKGSAITDWQREALAVAAGRVHAQLGEDAVAAELEKGVGENEMGKVAATRAEAFPLESFDAQMTLAEGWVKTLNFDLTRNAVDIAVAYYSSVFADSARRARVESLVEAANRHLALDLRVTAWLRLADVAREKSDRAAASAFIAKADALRAGSSWAPEDEAALLAQLASAKARAGDEKAARADLEAAVAIYDAGRERIIDIYRAKALRAVAESYAGLGDAAAARGVYMRALDEGAVNPNARPRAADLVATMLSMVSSGIEPDEAASARIASIREGLIDPW